MYGRHALATCRWQWYISDQNTVTKYQPLQSALPDTLCLTFPIRNINKFRNCLLCIQERLSVLAAECASALQTSSNAHSCNPPEASHSGVNRDLTPILELSDPDLLWNIFLQLFPVADDPDKFIFSGQVDQNVHRAFH